MHAVENLGLALRCVFSTIIILGLRTPIFICLCEFLDDIIWKWADINLTEDRLEAKIYKLALFLTWKIINFKKFFILNLYLHSKHPLGLNF